MILWSYQYQTVTLTIVYMHSNIDIRATGVGGGELPFEKRRFMAHSSGQEACSGRSSNGGSVK